MPSLSEAYTDRRDGRGGRDPRRVALGAAISLLGALALLSSLLVATTPLAGLVGAETAYEVKHLAGVLAGVGAPVVLLGVVAVLPSKRRQQIGVIVGALVAFAGVWLFSYAYPYRWISAPNPLAFETAVVYFAGGAMALWFVFVAIANFRRRNDPHGTINLEIRREGETRHVEVTPSELKQYRRAVGDGGTDDRIVQEIESRADE
jgi:multisubunit Na+/H+ antiporter MnhG subunit